MRAEVQAPAEPEVTITMSSSEAKQLELLMQAIVESEAAKIVGQALTGEKFQSLDNWIYRLWNELSEL